MRFIVTQYSVIMAIVWITNCNVNEINDLTERCTKNRLLRKYLTTGKESSDYAISLIANNDLFNCTILYTVQHNNFVMLVIEFLDWMPGKIICSIPNNTIIVTSASATVEVCTHLNVFQNRVFRQLGRDYLKVSFASIGNLTSIKLTATAMRYSGVLSCIKKSEIECIFENKVYCMTRQVICDRHINCGVSGWFDENLRMCQGTKLTPLVVLFTLIMTIVTAFLVISISMVFMPKRKQTFIYKIDETMSVFDSDYRINNYQINVHVVYPKTFPVPRDLSVSERRSTLSDSIQSTETIQQSSDSEYRV